jgi:uncharacterized protein (DUF779 family)
MENKVSATPAALELIAILQSEYGPILFHKSGGCCDGSSPMCYAQGDFIIGDQDVQLGEIGGAQVYISAPQYDVWKHTELIIDVVPGRGGMFSLDNGNEVSDAVIGRHNFRVVTILTRFAHLCNIPIGGGVLVSHHDPIRGLIVWMPLPKQQILEEIDVREGLSRAGKREEKRAHRQ